MIKAKLNKIILISVIFLIASINISFSALITPKVKPKEFLNKPLLPKKNIKSKIIPPKKKIIIRKNNEIKPQIKKVKVKTKSVENKKEKYLVSNQIIPIKKPEDLGINKFNSKILSKKDFQIAQKTFNFVKRKRWNSAFKQLKKSKNPLLKDLVQWMYLLENGNTASFEEYKKFIELKKEWPRINRLRYLAEHKIDFKDTRPRDVIDFFKNQEPLSGYGKIKLGEAYLIKGEKQIAHDLIAEGFNTANLSRDDHRYLHKKFKNLFTDNDYILRAEYLAWEQDFYELQRTIRYLPKGYKELYFARFALMTRSYGVDSAIAKVPPQLKNNIGLQFDRAKWRRKRGRYDSALEIINTLPNNPAALVKPDLWFKEKFIIARNKINSKKFEEAYELIINHGVTDSALLADAEWHAGWLALRFLNKPKEASQHFKIMYDGVNYPISKSRAAYWLGEALFKLGQKQKANEWYRKAAKFNTTFYGQLAAAKIEKDIFKVKNSFIFNKGEFDKFLKKDLSKAVILLNELNLSQKSKSILRHLGSEEKTLKEQVYAGLLSQEIGRLDFAIQIAKQASYQNINLLELNYPIIETPKKVSKKNILKQEVILALIRQESEFDGRANSWAGAKGLMQIMPATGKLVAKQAGLRYSRSKLTENEFFNLQIGSFYISNLTENLSGAKYMAFAAYNAGPHRVKKWIRRFGDPRKGEIDPVDWIELIPFNETRNYVQRVIENIQVYKYVINKKTVTNDIEKILF